MSKELTKQMLDCRNCYSTKGFLATCDLHRDKLKKERNSNKPERTYTHSEVISIIEASRPDMNPGFANGAMDKEKFIRIMQIDQYEANLLKKLKGEL